MIGFGHFPELIMVLVFALVIFGPKRLPEVGAGLGKSLREFQKATREVQETVTPAIVGTDTHTRPAMIAGQPAALQPDVEARVAVHHESETAHL